MTFLGALFGGVVSILTAWLTQRYNLRTQLQVKSAEADNIARLASRSEKENRYLSIVRNLDALYDGGEPAKRAAFLEAVREVWLLGDTELVRSLNDLLSKIAGKTSGDPRAPLVGKIILEMRRGLDLPNDNLTTSDFPSFRPGG